MTILDNVIIPALIGIIPALIGIVAGWFFCKAKQHYDIRQRFKELGLWSKKKGEE